MDTTQRPAAVTPPNGFPAPGAHTAGRAELDRVVAGTEPPPPFVARFGLPRPHAWEYGRIVAEFSAPEDTTAVEGVIFGGYIASLIDQQAYLALLSIIPDGTILLTQRLEIEFLAPLGREAIRVEGQVVDLTDRQAVCEVVVSQNGRPTSRGRVTQMLRPPR